MFIQGMFVLVIKGVKSSKKQFQIVGIFDIIKTLDITISNEVISSISLGGE